MMHMAMEQGFRDYCMELVFDGYYDYVREYLTDYNDNFVGEPCAEIIEEVLFQLL